MRIVHTADIHLDCCFAASGAGAAFGNRRRQSLRDVFHAIAARAGSWPADAFLIAGDLFEADRVTRDTVAFLIREFAAIEHVPVFIAPGNHDPYTAASPYATEAWPANVTIFSDPAWTSRALHDKNLVVHGFAFDGPDISQNPFGKLKVPRRRGNKIHIAVGHGSSRAHQPPNKRDYAPFDAADVVTPGLSYLALGHFHGLTKVAGGTGTAVYYSGAPEGHGFGEPGMHHYLEVEVSGDEVHVQPRPSSRLIYETLNLACDGFVSSQDVVDAVRARIPGEGPARILRVTLTGACAPDLHAELGAVYDSLAPDFEHLEILDRTEPLEDYAELAEDDTSLGVFLRTLGSEIRDATDDARRQLLERAREAGLAAFRNRDLDIRGMDRG